MSKLVITGLEGQGKSLWLADKVTKLLRRNHKWYKKTGIRRKIYSNLKFSKELEKEWPEYIKYWRHTKELVDLQDCDVVWDEISTDLDAQRWKDTSPKLKRWLKQSDKIGIELYSTAQEFADIDISFKRRVKTLLHIRKLFGSRRPAATKPPVKKIWGVCIVYELKVQGYEEEIKKKESMWPSFLFISEDICKIFDTSQSIMLSESPTLEHIERKCETCGKTHTTHR